MATYRGSGGSTSTTDQATIDQVAEDAATATTKAAEAATSAAEAASSASSANTARGSAVAYAGSAEYSANLAEDSKDAALAYKNEAFEYKNNAEDARDAAFGAETNAATSAASATTSAANAASAASEAYSSKFYTELFAEDAQKSAYGAENVIQTLSDGSTLYSARHYAAKTAADAVSTAADVVAAEAAKTAAEAAQEAIDGTYLGALSSDPTVDGNGDAVTVGDWYFNSTSNLPKIYDGSAWNTIDPSLAGDSSPELGGDLDLKGFDIVDSGSGSTSIANTNYNFTVIGGSTGTETQIIGGERFGGVEGAGAVLGYGAKIRAGDYYYGTGRVRWGGSLDISNNSSSPHLVTLSGGNVYTGITDFAGGSIQIIGGQSSGTASGGSITFKTYDGTGNTSGTTLGTLTTALTIDQTGTATFGNDIKLGDNDKAIFGAGSDLQIYHDGGGTGSYITENGTGVLRLRSENGDGVGLYGASNAVMLFARNGAEVDLRYNGSQKLATTSTGIDVTGTVTADGLTVDSSTTAQIDLNDRNGTVSSIKQDYTALTIDADVNNVYASSYARIRVDGVEGFRLSSGGDISFYEDTGTTAKLTWDASAESLGLGTSSPTSDAHLHISPASNNAIIRLEGALAEYWQIIGATNDKFIIQNETDGNVFAIENGNVGIGTSSPETTLHIQSSTASLCVSDGTFPNDRFLAIDVGITGSEDVQYITVDQADSLAFGEKTNNHDRTIVNEHMRIDSSGRLLVGTTSHVGNNPYISLLYGNSRHGMTFKNVNTTAYYAQVFYNSSSASVGSIYCSTTATAYNTSSDYRLKTDVQPMTGATERLKALKPVNFEWISTGTRVDGFLAHEAQEVVPEAVTGTKDAVDAEGNPEYQGIDQSKLVPLLVATIQELEARITQLENS